MCRGAGLDATIAAAAVPLLPAARSLARAGFATGASGRNLASYGEHVDGADPLTATLLSDPQTSGGLLVAVDPGQADALVARFRDAGFDAAARIGAFGPARDGAAPCVVVR